MIGSRGARREGSDVAGRPLNSAEQKAFDDAVKRYDDLMLSPMESLRDRAPFAAALLACASIDHLSNTIIEDVADADGDSYVNVLRDWLPGYKNRDIAERLYAALRCGLIHAFRTDDHEKGPSEAQPVRLTGLNIRPTLDGDDLVIGVPHLLNAVRHAWTRLAGHPDCSLKRRAIARLAVDVRSLPLTILARVDGGDVHGFDQTSTASPAASGMGSNFSTRGDLANIEDLCALESRFARRAERAPYGTKFARRTGYDG